MDKGYAHARDPDSPTELVRQAKRAQGLAKSHGDGPRGVEEVSSPLTRRAGSLARSLQEEQRQRNLRLQASPRMPPASGQARKRAAEQMASWAVGQMSRTRESRKVVDALRGVYRLQWLIAVLAVAGFLFAMRCEHLCTRGYQPLPEEIAEGAEDPFVLDPVDSKCGECTLLKTGASLSTLCLLVAMAVQFRYRLRVLDGRMRLTTHHDLAPAVSGAQDPKESEGSKAQGAEMVMHWTQRGWMYAGFVVEMAVCAVHPLWWYANDYRNEMMGREVYYRFESVIASVMLVRAYHLLRLYLLHVQWRFLADRAAVKGETQGGTMQLLQDPRIDLVGFALKQAVAGRPAILVGLVLSLCVMCGAYLIRIGETPANSVHAEYVWNNLWLAVLALTTSDYGDVAPATHYGRGICVVLMMAGPLILASAAFSLSVALTLSPLEQDISIKLAHDHVMARVRLAAARMLQLIFRKNRGLQIRVHGELCTTDRQIQQLRSELCRDFLHEAAALRSFRARHATILDSLVSTKHRHARPSCASSSALLLRSTSSDLSQTSRGHSSLLPEGSAKLIGNW